MDQKSGSLCLLCEEDPFLRLSPSPPPSTSSRPRQPTPDEFFSDASPPKLRTDSNTIVIKDERDDDCTGLDDVLQKRERRRHEPHHAYALRLQHSSFLSAARTRAVRYFILVCSRLNLAIGTVFNAVNYLDRFISIDYTLRWEEWMMELLSIACLSIACKMEDVSIPTSLHDLQMDNLEHSFEAITIQEMELTVLKKLDWRLACITPYSYVEALMWVNVSDEALPPPSCIITRMIELLLYALLDNKFLQFGPSNIAASALKAIAGTETAFSTLTLVFPEQQHMTEMNECQKLVDDLFIGIQRDEQASEEVNGQGLRCPNSVISLGTIHNALGFNLKLHCLSDAPVALPNLKKPKRDDNKI